MRARLLLRRPRATHAAPHRTAPHRTNAGKLNEDNWVHGVTVLMRLLQEAIERFKAAATDMF